MTRAGGTSAVGARGAIPDFGRFRNKSCSSKRLFLLLLLAPTDFSDLLPSLNAERAQTATE